MPFLKISILVLVVFAGCKSTNISTDLKVHITPPREIETDFPAVPVLVEKVFFANLDIYQSFYENTKYVDLQNGLQSGHRALCVGEGLNQENGKKGVIFWAEPANKNGAASPEADPYTESPTEKIYVRDNVCEVKLGSTVKAISMNKSYPFTSGKVEAIRGNYEYQYAASRLSIGNIQMSLITEFSPVHPEDRRLPFSLASPCGATQCRLGIDKRGNIALSLFGGTLKP